MTDTTGLRGAALAYAALDHIEANPEQWKQKVWWCGAAGCFAGWSVALARGPKAIDRVWVKTDGPLRHVQIDAIGLLGLADDDADRLFDSENTLDDLRRIVGELFGPRPGGERS